jgi:hypothetical protein
VAPKAAARALLLDDETFATPLFLLVMDTCGHEVLPGTNPDGSERDGWTPQTIKEQLELEFSLRLPKESLDKIMAAITIVTTNFFWKDVTRFIELCNILSGDDFQPDEFDPADAGEILWGVTEASILWPPDDDAEDTEFSEEIRTYIGEVLKVEGIEDPPDLLRLGMSGTAGQVIDDTFADDPEMYNAVWDVQRGKTDELKQMVTGNLRMLAFQLQILPLQNGNKTDVLEQIQRVAGMLPGDQEEPQAEGGLI